MGYTWNWHLSVLQAAVEAGVSDLDDAMSPPPSPGGGGGGGGKAAHERQHALSLQLREQRRHHAHSGAQQPQRGAHGAGAVPR